MSRALHLAVAHPLTRRSARSINADPERLKRMAEKSGVSFYEAQAALGRVFLGRDALPSELEKNKTVEFALGIEGGEALNLKENKDKAKNAPPTVKIDLPQDYDAAWETIRKFEAGDDVREQISDSVAGHAMKGSGSLLNEAWSGDEASERNAFVTEELYIHSSEWSLRRRCDIAEAGSLTESPTPATVELFSLCLLLYLLRKTYNRAHDRRRQACHLRLGQPQRALVAGRP